MKQLSLSASDIFPKAPSTEVVAALKSLPLVPEINKVTNSFLAAVPSVTAISSSIGMNSTVALVGQAAKLAAVGPAANAITKGFGVVTDSSNKLVASVGALAASPAQMEKAGILKPGSGALVASLIATGKTVEQAFSDNLFTGKPGAENLKLFVNNPKSQAEAMVSTLKQAQSALTKSGVLTGKESAAIGGLVLGAAVSSPSAAIGLLKGTPNLAAAANTLSGDISSIVASGNFASSISSGSTAIAKAVSKVTGSIDSAKGEAATAFSAITSSLKPLKAGVPQDLSAIAKTATSGIDAIPGGLAAVNSVLSKTKNSISSLAGPTSIKNAVTQVTNAITNKLSIPKINLPNLSTLSVAGLGAAAASKLSASINAFGGGLASVSKIPALVSDTLNRTGIDEKTKKLMGSMKIEPPDFVNKPTEGPTETDGVFAEIKTKVDASYSLIADRIAKQKEIISKQIEFQTASNDLPQGDPRIEQLRQAWLDKVAEFKDINTEIDNNDLYRA